MAELTDPIAGTRIAGPLPTGARAEIEAIEANPEEEQTV